MASSGRALIVGDGAARGALAAARALRAAGWTIGVGTPDARGLAAASRATTARHLVPAPRDGVDAFTAAVAAAVERERYELVFGAGDAEVLALSLARRQIGATVPYPPHETVARALDKLQLTAAAQAAGVRTPRTWATAEAAVREHTGPVCVKARVHGRPDRPGAPARIVMEIAPHPRAAERRVAEIAALGGESLLQEVVDGRLVAFATVADASGSLAAAVQQEAEATWPPHAGVTARGYTVPTDPRLAKRVGALLRELGWFGLAQVQFIVGADGEPRLIDLNGRFYGSLALATGAGVNLPAIWASLAAGGPVAFARAAHGGERYQWLQGDLRRALANREGRRARELAGCLRYAVAAHHSVASLRDPAPSLHVLADGTRRALARRRDRRSPPARPRMTT
jgi:predicted ATP-grasp superfamily ATP-dependent carboligase